MSGTAAEPYRSVKETRLSEFAFALVPSLRRSEKPPKDKTIVTLKDAAAYIMRLPAAEQQSPEWHSAGEAVIMAAEDRGPLMHAHVGMLRTLTRNVERVFNPDRQDLR